jgi:hypothetical protein
VSIDRRELLVGSVAAAASAAVPAVPLPGAAAVAVEEAAPRAVLSRGVVLRAVSDPLGYNMSHGIEAAIKQMTEDALRGRHAEAVEEELAAVRRAFGKQ